MRPKFRRLLFFALETSLLSVIALSTAGSILGRRIYHPLVGFFLLGLAAISFFGLPIWCAVNHASEPHLARVAALTLISVILWWFACVFFIR